MKRASK